MERDDIVITKTNTDSVVYSVISQFKQRSEVGLSKYGVNLDRTDLSLLEWIQHAQEEHMDAILYLEKIKQGDSIVSTLQREKFSSQASPDVLAALRELAATQGRQFQAVLDDAMRDYLERQSKSRPRQHVMATFASSLEEFDSLYRDLAK